MRYAWMLVLLTLAVLLAPRPARADDAVTLHDHWYVLMMQGQRAGWMHESTVRDCTEVTSTSDLSLTMKRGEISVEITLKSTFAESHTGKPLWMETVQKLGAIPTTTRYTFGEKEVTVESHQGDSPATKSTQPLPEGEWLPPFAASEFVTKRLTEGADEIVVRSIDPSMGLKPITSTRRIKARNVPIEVLGKTVPALKWDVVTDIMPAAALSEFVDEHGIAVRSTTDMGGIKVETLLADKDLATSNIDPPELLLSTLVQSDQPIDDPRKTTKAVYILSVPDGTLPDLPAAASQRFTRLDNQGARISIDTTSPRPADAKDAADESFTKPSAFLGSDDPEVVHLAERAVARLEPGASAAKRAEALRKFVYSHINKKNLGVGFATAGEVARTRSGDCSEHGALLAAMLRAQGIPSRVASGLLYMDQFGGKHDIFGYHMWAQGLLEVDGKLCWVDLDGTFPGDRPTDATHIALAVSAMDDGATQNAMVALAPLLGRLEVKVEKAE